MEHNARGPIRVRRGSAVPRARVTRMTPQRLKQIRSRGGLLGQARRRQRQKARDLQRFR